MRVGSIGSLGAYFASNNNVKKQQKNSPSFKADIRIEKNEMFSNKHMPDEHGINMLKLLTYAQTAYKDWGSDNILITLKPKVNGEKGNNTVSNIEIKSMYKDPELGRKEILENIENNPSEDGYDNWEDIVSLRKREPEIMARLKNIENDGDLFSTASYKDRDRKMPDKELLDKEMKLIIDSYIEGPPSPQRLMIWGPDKLSREEKSKLNEFLYSRVDYPLDEL